MRNVTLAFVLAAAPGYLAAQSQATGQAAASAVAQAQAPAGFSAATQARLDATLQAARERSLPTQPLYDRIAEGQAKGASEVQIVAATERTEAQLAASQQAMISAGRRQPSGPEVARGAQLIASGATSAQLEAFVRRAPAERRLEVAFQVVSDLAASGVPVTQAMTVVGAQLGGGASDRGLITLGSSGQANGSATATGSGSASPSGGQASGSAGAQAGAGTSVGVGTTALGTSAAGTISGTLGVGVIRKP